MKTVWLLLCLMSVNLLGDEHRFLISGFTKHEQSHNRDGYEFNEVNLGAGYEYTTFEDYNRFYFGTNFTVLKDSFRNLQYTLSASSNIRFELSQNSAISIGVAAFAMYKKDAYKIGMTQDNAEYDFLYGAAPLASLYYDRLTVNFAYVPSVSYEQIDTVGFLIVYFGWKIN